MRISHATSRSASSSPSPGRRSRFRTAPLSVHSPDGTAAASDDNWETLRPVLDEAMSKLSERDRDAVMLRLFEERPFAEIGRALRLTEDAARMRVDRALDRLRRHLRHRGLTSTTAALSLVLANQGFALTPPGLATTIAGTAVSAAKITSGSAFAGGLITFMSATKTLTTTLGALAAVAIGVATYYTREAHRTGTMAATLEREIDHLKHRTAELNAQARLAAAKPPAGTSTQLASSRDQAATPPTPALTAQATVLRENYEARKRLRANDPQFQQLSIRATRVSTRIDYAALSRTLNLTTVQIERFEELMAARAWNSMDLVGAQVSLGLPPGDPALQAETSRQERAFQSSLREILGDEGANQFSRYEAAAPLRNLLSQLAGNVYYTDTPLAPAQASELSQIITRHYPDLENLDSRWRTDPAAWEAILREARAVLAPAQLAALTAIGDGMPWVVESVRELNKRPTNP